MSVTLACVAIAFGSLWVFGIPLLAALRLPRTFEEHHFVVAPFLGLAAIVLFSQNLVYLGIPTGRSAPWAWGLAVLAWGVIVRRRGWRPVPGAPPRPLLAALALVFGIQGAGLFALGARTYFGDAWLDQFNYTVLADFLAHQPWSLPPEEIGLRPYLFPVLLLQHHRLGQSAFHAFFVSSTGLDAKTLFEPTILVAPVLTCLVVYGLARRAELGTREAIPAALLSGALPALAMIHLSGFLSQALFGPLLLCLPLLLESPDRKARLGPPLALAVILAAAGGVYHEMLPVAVSVVGLGSAYQALAQRSARPLLILAATLVAALALNPATLGIALKSSLTDRGVLAWVYPWAGSPEGLGRLWFGPLVENRWSSWLTALGVALTLASLVGIAGRLRPQALAGGQAPLAVVCAAAMVAPAFVLAAFDRSHPYQFYKLLLTTAPALPLGLALLAQGGRLASWAGPLGLTVAGAGMFGTLTLVLEATRSETSPRHRGWLQAREAREVQDALEARQGADLLLLRCGSEELNAWLAYFARRNRVRLTDPSLYGFSVESLPQTSHIAEPHVLPRDALVLTTASDLVETPALEVLWRNTAYALCRRRRGSSVALVRAQGEAGATAGGATVWLGRTKARLTVLAARPGMLRLEAVFRRAPGQPSGCCRVEVTGPYSSEQLQIGDERKRLSLAVRAGANEIVLGAMEGGPATATRRLLLRVEAVALEEAAALVPP